MDENIPEQRSEMQDPAEEKISREEAIEEGQEHSLDIEKELAAKKDDTEHRQRKQKIKKEEKVLQILKKAEEKEKNDENRRKKEGKGDIRLKQMTLAVLDEGEKRKEMKGRIIRDPMKQNLYADHNVTSVLKVEDKEIKGNVPEKENTMINLLGQSLGLLPVESKSEDAAGKDQRVRWWRKQGFY